LAWGHIQWLDVVFAVLSLWILLLFVSWTVRWFVN